MNGHRSAKQNVNQEFLAQAQQDVLDMDAIMQEASFGVTQVRLKFDSWTWR